MPSTGMRSITPVALAFSCASVVLAAAAASSESGPRLIDGSSTYHSISRKVNALEQHLAEAEQENSEALAKKRAKYVARIQYFQQENSAVAFQNRQISQSIREVNDANKKLRHEAAELRQEGEEWLHDWLAMKSNITTALEVTQRTLGALQSHPAPELDVLTELEEQEAVRRAKAEHLDRLAEIAPVGLPGVDADGPALSLVQVSQATMKRRSPDPKSALRVLEVGFAELGEANRQQEAELDREFAGKLRDQQMRRDDLLAEQRALNTTFEEASMVQSRLKVAVEHLQAMNANLAQGGLSIRGYAQRLGSRALPDTAARAAAHEDATTATTTTTTSSAIVMVERPVAVRVSSTEPPSWKRVAEVLDQALPMRLPETLQRPRQQASNLRAVVATAKDQLQTRVKAEVEKAAQVVENERQRGIKIHSASMDPEPQAVGGSESPLSSWMQWLR